VIAALPTCRHCKAVLPPVQYNMPTPLPCPQCGRASRVLVFPALVQPPPPVPRLTAVTGNGDAGCFYHPAKQATMVCDGCGRFLCALCDVELGSEHLCPPCLEAGRRKRTLTRLETRRVLYDNVAMALAVLPILTCFLFPITSPAAIGMAIWGWRKPGSLLPRTKARFVIAIIIGVLGIGAGIAYWTAIIRS